MEEEEEVKQLERDLVFEPRKRKTVIKYSDEISEEALEKEKEKKSKVLLLFIIEKSNILML